MTEGATDASASHDDDDLPARGVTKRRLMAMTLLFWAWTAAVFAVWSLATPLLSSPDSPAHELRAYGAGQGQIVLPDPPADAETPYASSGVVEVPRGLVTSAASLGCYAFKPEVSAACIEPVSSDKTPLPYIDGVGEYLPLYYLATGWPSRFLPSGPRPAR